MRRFHQALSEFAACNPWFFYYYVTAREMANLVRQAENGITQPAFGTSSATPHAELLNNPGPI